MQPARYTVLTTLEEAGAGLTPREVADALAWTRERASMALLRAHRWGLAWRHRGVYALSQKGAGRLAWLRGGGST